MFKQRTKDSSKAKNVRRRKQEEEAGSSDDAADVPAAKRPKKREGGLTASSHRAGRTHYQDAPDKIGAQFSEELDKRLKEREGREDYNYDAVKKESKGPKPPGKTALRMASKVVSDFRPGICKPYYQRGYCKWGDTCKYAHITERYQNEQEIDAAWDRKQAAIASGGTGSDSDSDSDDDDDGLTCPVCANRFNDPVVTRFCKHVFCADCAVSQVKCKVCGRPTNGIFNMARAVVQQLKAIEEHEKRADQSGGGGDSDGSLDF